MVRRAKAVGVDAQVELRDNMLEFFFSEPFSFLGLLLWYYTGETSLWHREAFRHLGRYCKVEVGICSE